MSNTIEKAFVRALLNETEAYDETEALLAGHAVHHPAIDSGLYGGNLADVDVSDEGSLMVSLTDEGLAEARTVVAELRASGAKLAKCPAQLRDTDCSRCGLCWERPDLCIVFDPHGASKRKAAEVAPSHV